MIVIDEVGFNEMFIIMILFAELLTPLVEYVRLSLVRFASEYISMIVCYINFLFSFMDSWYNDSLSDT